MGWNIGDFRYLATRFLGSFNSNTPHFGGFHCGFSFYKSVGDTEKSFTSKRHSNRRKNASVNYENRAPAWWYSQILRIRFDRCFLAILSLLSRKFEQYSFIRSRFRVSDARKHSVDTILRTDRPVCQTVRAFYRTFGISLLHCPIRGTVKGGANLSFARYPPLSETANSSILRYFDRITVSGRKNDDGFWAQRPPIKWISNDMSIKCQDTHFVKWCRWIEQNNWLQRVCHFDFEAVKCAFS